MPFHKSAPKCKSGIPQEPRGTLLVNPRERVGQDSISSDAVAGHSAPVLMPRSALNMNRKVWTLSLIHI